jgi:hypothetical protein
LKQKYFHALKGVALPFFCSGSLRFLLKRLHFGASDGDVFAVNSQFCQLFET